MKRLVCIVEGQGEVAAIPNLCARILQHVGAQDWIVDPVPIRQPEQTPNAKDELRKLIPGYLPTVHQLAATRKLDISHVRARSDSFDKLVRAIGSLCGRKAPARPATGG